VAVGVLGAFLLAYSRARVFDSVIVDGRSMYPTFDDRTRVFAWQGCYQPGSLKRGEILILSDPTDGTLVVKRVVALGGETLTFAGEDIYVNGKRLNEPYLNQQEPLLQYEGSVLVPPRSVWVMGDNRNHSSDSRDYGPVPLKDVRSRPFLAFWPPREWGRGQQGAS